MTHQLSTDFRLVARFQFWKARNFGQLKNAKLSKLCPVLGNHSGLIVLSISPTHNLRFGQFFYGIDSVDPEGIA